MSSTSIRPPSIRRAIASAVVATILASGAIALGAAPAHAAGITEQGIGIGSLSGSAEYPNGGAGWLGSLYVPGLGYVYCVNPSLETGYSNDPTSQSSYSRDYVANSGWSAVNGYAQHADITPREAFDISYIIGAYGQLDAPRSGYSLEQATWAAAVELAVWDRSVSDFHSSYGTTLPSDLFSPRAAGWETNVLAKLSAINADVAGQMPSGTTTASGSLNVEMTNYRDGELVVNLAGVVNADTVLTLNGAVFTATGSNTMTVNATNGLRIPITGAYSPSVDAGQPTYDITATGTATVLGSGYGESVRILHSDGQTTATVGEPAPATFDLSAGTVAPIILFDAVVSTEAPRFIAEGETFTDTLFATIANPTDPASNPWPQDTGGEYVPVEARGTLYGPFLGLPDESPTAPSWAPVVATDIPVTLNGPGEYQADAEIGALEPGYYTWVWSVDAADQHPAVSNFMPADYNYTDAFAQTIESTISPSNISAVSQVPEAEVAITDEVSDTLTVGSSGGWIQKNGARVPVTFDGTAYFVEGEEAPEISDEVPAGAEVLGTRQITATGPGTYDIPSPLTAPAREGHVVWVWEINEASQPAEFQGYMLDWADQFGIPAEMTKVVAPVVTTQARTDVPVGDPIWDTAVVTGRIPDSGLDLHFELYEATKNDNGEWVCEAGNLLWTSTQQTIDAEGTYQSPNAPVQPEGTYHWVEVVTTPGGEEVSRGVCGLPNETSVVTVPEVTTQAQPGAKLGEEPGLFDVATVTGPIAEAGYNLTFEAYKDPVVKDETTGEWVIDYPEGFEPSEEPGANNLTWVCDAEPVFTTEEAIHVTAEGDFTSESFVPEEFGKYLFVETLTTIPAEGEESLVVHRGECGIAEESSVIVDVTTKAQTDNGDQTGDNGEQAWDKAILNGYVPEGATVEIRAFRADADVTPSEACTESNLTYEWASEPLRGGLVENLEIDSAKFTPKALGTDSKVYFIETTKDALGRTVSTGECGEPDETLSVSGDGTIAWTGGDSTPALWVGGVALLALFGAAGVYMILRRQSA